MNEKNQAKHDSNSDTVNGIILKGVSGVYTCLICLDERIRTDETFLFCNNSFGGTIKCAARGIFRNKDIIPLAGDYVEIVVLEDGTGRIEDILPRKNSLLRPPLANIDLMAIVVSVLQPSPNTLVIDKMTVMAEYAGIHPIIVINKIDMDDKVKNQKNSSWYKELYQNAGFETYTLSADNNIGIDEFKNAIKGKTVAFAGNSGVGKSSLLNMINPELVLKVGGISEKLGRGRHTTRVTELLLQSEGGFFVDTPGFSSIDIARVLSIEEVNLDQLFIDIANYSMSCQFSNCKHIKEIGCFVTDAVKDGKIQPERYASYVAILRELEAAREW